MNELRKHINSYSVKKMIHIVKSVCKTYRTGRYTLESACENAGVPYRTFINWWRMYEIKGSQTGCRWAKLAEVADLWRDAQEKRWELERRKLVSLAETMMEKRITGYTYEEVTTEVVRSVKDGQEILLPVSIKKIVRHVSPSDCMIRFVLTKLCSNYGDHLHRFNVNSERMNIDYRSIEDIEAEIKELESDLILE